MTITASGIYQHPMEAKESLASSSTWQSIVGADDATEALASIYVHQGEASSYPVPRCGIIRSEGFSRYPDGTGDTAGGRHQEGSVALCFALPIPASYGGETIDDDEDALIYVENIIGAIIRELEQNIYVANSFRNSGCLFNFRQSVILDDPYLGPYEEEQHDPESPDDWNDAIGYMSIELII